jgi:hypothetical protein
MHSNRSMLVLGFAFLLCASSVAVAQQNPQQPIAPVQPVAPTVPNTSDSSKSTHAGKKHSHAEDFLIIGTVFTPQGLALPAAELRIRRMGEQKYRWKTETNSRGDFAVRVPKGSSYEVSVSAKGLPTYTATVDALQTGDNQQRLSIRMESASGGTK